MIVGIEAILPFSVTLPAIFSSAVPTVTLPATAPMAAIWVIVEKYFVPEAVAAFAPVIGSI